MLLKYLDIKLKKNYKVINTFNKKNFESSKIQTLTEFSQLFQKYMFTVVLFESGSTHNIWLLSLFNPF